MERLRDQFGWVDRLRYLWWRLRASPRPLVARLNGNTVLTLRPLPANDLYVANEIFVRHVYRPPKPLPKAPKRIVDVGANVGFSCLYWSQAYPGCSITAFEPVPQHVQLLRDQLARNPRANVTVQAAAACAAAGTVYLAGSESHTSAVHESAKDATAAPAVDFFAAVGGERIDLLKIDIEGGEYELLEDPRFASLNFEVLVLEWHRTQNHPNGLEYCLNRLSSMGLQTIQTATEPQTGIIWAYRSPA